MLFNGPSGDINHIDPFSAEPRSDPGISRRIADTLAEAAAAVEKKITCRPVETMNVQAERITLPHRIVTKEAAAQAEEDIRRHPADTMKVMMAKAVLHLYRKKVKAVDYEWGGFSLGSEFQGVFLSGEVFTDIGLRIREKIDCSYVWVIQNSNRRNSYIPTRKAFEDADKNRQLVEDEFPAISVTESIGMDVSYETSPISTEVDKEAEDIIVNAVTSNLAKE
jgi:hypothetical protein